MRGNQINDQLVDEAGLLAQGYRKYSGQSMDVYYNQAICAHVGNCVRGDSALFEVGRRPWIDPKQMISETNTIAVIDSCPSGALKWIKKGAEHE